jgi:signal transduction histidine kinase
VSVPAASADGTTGTSAATVPGMPRARSPWTESRFWVLQVTVLALALGRLAVTVSFGLDPAGLVLEVSTVVIFVVPVVLASLNWGLPGGVFTVAWTIVLNVPRFAVAASRGDTAAVWAEVAQVAVLVLVAVLIGHRVTAATVSRDQADAASAARIRAEQLYQDMFESNQSPILIVDADGFVVGSNASADRVFGHDPRPRDPSQQGRAASDHDRLPRPPRLVDRIGPDAAALVLTRLISVDDSAAPPTGDDLSDTDADTGTDTDEDADADAVVAPVAFVVNGEPVLFRPTVTLVGSGGTDRRMQVIFEDVTAETRRHDLIEAYANQVMLGQEEERRHIAQELHDGPLQTLIHLCRQIDALDEGAGSGADPNPSPSLAVMRSTVEGTVAELRSIARGLRPSVLDDLGLAASINQLLSEATARQGFESSFDVVGTERRLPSSVELALFRIAQEAITNVERHAGASRTAVRLGFEGRGVRLQVEDDGAGFDRGRQQREDSGESLGLPGMSERARLSGGRFRIRSQVGKGTTVDAWVPGGPSDLG